MLFLKLTLLAFASFATLSYAIPSPRGHEDPKALILNANARIEPIVQSFSHVSPDAKPDYLVSILDEVGEIVGELVNALRLTSLGACGCTGQDILVLIAMLFKTILEPIFAACGSYSDLAPLLSDSNLITSLLQLVNAVVSVLGGSIAELVFLLIGNGCAGSILGLNIGGLVQGLGLGNLIGHLL